MLRIVLSPERASSTIRARNSWGYGGFGFGIVGSFSHSEVDSTKPGQLQTLAARERRRADSSSSHKAMSVMLGARTSQRSRAEITARPASKHCATQPSPPNEVML